MQNSIYDLNYPIHKIIRNTIKEIRELQRHYLKTGYTDQNGKHHDMTPQEAWHYACDVIWVEARDGADKEIQKKCHHEDLLEVR